MSRSIVQAMRAPIAALLLVGSAAVASPAFADNDFVVLSGGSISEGDSGQANLTFTASVASSPSVPINMRFTAVANHTTTQAGDATAGSACGGTVDFVAVDGTVSIQPGTNQVSISVPVCGDSAIEGSETFTGLVRDVQGAGAYCLELCAAFGTITDNDTAQPIPFGALPGLSVSNASVTEGDPSIFLQLAHHLSFAVSLSAASTNTVTVDYQTAPKLATGGRSCLLGTDYISTSGSLTFNPGETRKTVSVTTCFDNLAEANETMILRLSNPTNATLVDDLGVGIILNDD
jgi:hypothetical protein